MMLSLFTVFGSYYASFVFYSDFILALIGILFVVSYAMLSSSFLISSLFYSVDSLLMIEILFNVLESFTAVGESIVYVCLN